MRRSMVPLVLVGLLALPTLPAHAATGPDVVVFEAEGSLYRAAPDLTGAVLIGEEDGRVEDVRASADGSRFTYTTVQVGAPGRPNDRRTRVVVRDVSGRQVAVVGDEIGYDGGDVISGPAVGLPSLSADGNRVMWASPTGWRVGEVQDKSAGRAIALTSGDPLRAPRFVGPLDEVLSVGLEPFVEGTSSETILQVKDGQATKLRGLVGPAADFAVAPDGSTVAYVSYQAGSDKQALNVAPLSRSFEGLLGVGTPTQLVADFQDENGPRYSHDGSTLFWSTPGRDLMSVPIAGGPVTQRTDTVSRLESAAVGMTLDDGSPPGPVAVRPFLLDGLNVRLRWTLPTDADLSGVLVQARTSSGYVYPVAFVPAAANEYNDFSYGQVNYELFAVDRSGHVSSMVNRSALPIRAFATFPTPIATGTRPTFTVSLPTGVRNRLWYRPYGASTPLILLLDLAEQSTYTFDQARPGGNYSFLVQSYDAFGNHTSTVGGGTAMVPFDQNRAAFSGSVLTESRPDRYLGSATILRTAGSAARFTTSATLLRIVGERCRSCGVMDVYVDGSRIAGVDTYSADRKVRQVLLSKGLTSGKHTVVIKARGTARHPWVVLDALGLR